MQGTNMKRSILKSAPIMAGILFLTMALAAPLSAKPLTERQKIQALLNEIGKAKGMVFIRNGVEHKAARAKSHLAYKYSRTKSRIRTARHFIKYLGTKSSWTGIAYKVRLKNGKTMPSAVWLNARLTEIEARDRKKNRKK